MKGQMIQQTMWRFKYNDEQPNDIQEWQDKRDKVWIEEFKDTLSRIEQAFEEFEYICLKEPFDEMKYKSLMKYQKELQEEIDLLRYFLKEILLLKS